jgi:hypothetical protein
MGEVFQIFSLKINPLKASLEELKKQKAIRLDGLLFIHFADYTLKWANALLASAMRCVSSFFLNAEPSPFAAETISAASLSAMLRPFLSRL